MSKQAKLIEDIKGYFQDNPDWLNNEASEYILDDFLTEKINAYTTHVVNESMLMGKSINEIAVILRGLEIEMHYDIPVTMKNLGKLYEKMKEEQSYMLQKVFERQFYLDNTNKDGTE